MSEGMKREGIENARRNGGVTLSLKEGSKLDPQEGRSSLHWIDAQEGACSIPAPVRLLKPLNEKTSLSV